MTNRLIIIPYISDHGKIIMESQMNHMLTQRDAEYVGQLPRLIDVSMNFTPIHNFAPEYGQKFISPDPARRSSSTDDIA